MGHTEAIPVCNHPITDQGKLDTLSQHAMCKQAIPACNWPIGSQGSEACFLSMHCKN